MTVLMDMPAANAGETRSQPLSYTPALPIGVLQLVAVVILAFKLAFSFVVPPGYDDAYYWLWGQHLQWSYLDHAPMVGWGAWVSYRLFGWSLFALHFMPLVSTLIAALVLRAWARRIAPEHWRHYFWAGLAIFLASPLLMAITSILYPDQILIAMSLAALHFLALFLADWRVGHRRYLNLYVGAIFLGLALLSKYNGALIGFGLVAAVLADPKLRPLLRTPHFWLAGLLAAAFFLPILGWNLTHEFASLKLHSADRFAGRGLGFGTEGTVRFAWQTALYFSPFLLWPLLKSLVARGVTGPEGAMIAMGRWIFVASTIPLVLLSAWVPAASQVAPHWEVVALLPFLLLAPLFVRPGWLLGLHLAFGTLAAIIVGSYFLFAPLVTEAVGATDVEASTDYGQDQLAQAVGRAKWMTNASFVGTRRYNVAAKLAWGAGSDAGMISLNDEIDQFYFWRDVGAYQGQSGIILEEGPMPPGLLRDKFASIDYLGPVSTYRFGHWLATYHLYLGHGYKGRMPNF
ncbi:MAG TPA: glycosyltransferase family 39 protein [Devosiaceae bacterium]|jgi:4-amino-4-deoxy-L-arabinose transferase-like glycosyltransferase|nr:glycosyltransferase family 39 protein [Devosiaceae bacterium]